MPMPNPDNLPDTLEIDLPANFHAPTVEPKAELQEVIAADTQVANDMLQILYQAWGKVRTIREVVQMTSATMQVAQQRRNLMNLPYGNKTDGSGGDGVVKPLS